MNRFKPSFEQFKHTISGWKFPAAMAFLSYDQLLDYTERMTQSAASIYDKALDAEYLKTHIGGGNHRMFDGGHDPISAWTSIKDAAVDDSFTQEVQAYLSAMLKDVSTNKGLPFTTWDQSNYQQMADWVTAHIPFISKDHLYDMLSFDLLELFASGLSVVVVIFQLNEDDVDKILQTIGSLGGLAIFAANPLLIFPFLYAMGAVLYRRRSSQKGLSLTKKDGLNLGKGFAKAGISYLAISMLGLPLVLLFIIAISSIMMFKRMNPQKKDQIKLWIKETTMLANNSIKGYLKA
jgi:hypothetical protein